MDFQQKLQDNRAYSIDFWRTLAVSNPFFSKRRLECFTDLLEISQSKLEFHIEHIGKLSDGLNVSGVYYSAENMFHLLLERCQSVKDNITGDTLMTLSNQLFKEYPPKWIEETTAFLLKAKSHGILANLASNTGYVQGEIMSECMMESGILDLFEFAIYSDEIRSSKPQSHFFSAIKSAYEPNCEIIHIGDDIYTDVFGANQSGLNAFHFGSVPLTFPNIEKHATKSILQA